VLVAVGVALYFQRLLEQGFVVASIGEGGEVFHGWRIILQERHAWKKVTELPGLFKAYGRATTYI
jgi:hypothetical protein